MEPCDVVDLKKMAKRSEFNRDIHPIVFYDGALQYAVRDWTDLSIVFVEWLVRHKHLSTDKLPVPNYAYRGKLFINSRPAHDHVEKDGAWKQVGPYFIDTKYNAHAHIQNILSTVERLQIVSPNFSISFKSDQS